MIFSVSASTDRKTYTVVNNTTRQTAQLVYTFSAYDPNYCAATVSGDFCLVPFGINGFPLPTDLPLSEFGQIGITFWNITAISRAGDGSTSHGTTGRYDSTSNTGIFEVNFDFSIGLIEIWMARGATLQISYSGCHLDSYLTASPTNYTDSAEG